MNRLGDVEAKTRVSARVLINVLSVYEDNGVTINAAEVQPYPFSFGCRRNCHIAPIPGRVDRKVSVAGVGTAPGPIQVSGFALDRLATRRVAFTCAERAYRTTREDCGIGIARDRATDNVIIRKLNGLPIAP